MSGFIIMLQTRFAEFFLFETSSYLEYLALDFPIPEHWPYLGNMAGGWDSFQPHSN